MSARKPKVAVQNRILSQATFVTNIGDYLSFFATLVLVQKSTHSVLIAAYTWPLKSLGMAIGGMTLPLAMTYFRPRTLIVLSQLAASFTCAAVALAATIYSEIPAELLFASLFISNILQRYFEGARETYSKALAVGDEHRSLSAEIMQGFYGAQVVGPILSFGLITLISPVIPLWLDAASFIVTGLMCLRLGNVGLPTRYSIWRPLKYLSPRTGLGQIFLLRSVGFWIPVGLWNYLVFSVISEHYGLTLINSAWTFAAVGAGATVAATALKWSRASGAKAGPVAQFFASRSDAGIALGALAVMSVTRIVFLRLPSLQVAIGIVFIGGICAGLNAVATQSLRRKLASHQQFPEVVGLETVVGKFVDWAVVTGLVVLMTKTGVGYEAGVWISASLTIVLALLHRVPGIWRV